DVYAFAVYGRDGWDGVHRWWNFAFGVNLQAAFHVNMDGFVEIVDEVGPVWVEGEQMGGEDLLVYLRDNENNWGCEVYDCDGRQFKALLALYDRAREYITDEPFKAATFAVDRWGGLVEASIQSIRQYAWVFGVAWEVKNSAPIVEFVQLADPYVVRGDVPLEPGRAEVVAEGVDLHEWLLEVYGD
nr:hypothetical protein [Gemmatimonadales bacterium]